MKPGAVQSLKGDDMVRVLNAIVYERGQPETIKTDSGSEFISKVMDKWAYERRVELDFSRLGKPTDNAMVESFNGRLRQECLNEHWFISLADAQTKIEAWRRFYNEARAAQCARLANTNRVRSTDPASAGSVEDKSAGNPNF
jgi:putative transposase